MRKLIEWSVLVIASLSAGCGSGVTPTVGGFERNACTGANCTDIVMVFPNPTIAPSTTAGGGILGAPQTVTLPVGASNFRVHVDDSIQFLNTGTGNQGPIDSAYYSIRLASILVITGDVTSTSWAIVPLNTTSSDYPVGDGATAAIYPIWQVVVDSPADRTLVAGTIASDASVESMPAGADSVTDVLDEASFFATAVFSGCS